MVDRLLPVAGFVLAGGASRRMGRPKHELTLGAETLLARAARLLGSVAVSVAVLGPPERALGLDMAAFPDEIPGRGPLGAIYTGLRHTRAEYNVFLSCDLPFMEARFLHYLAKRALESQADVTLAETPSEGLQPLAAVYRRRARRAIAASLAADQNKITHFFPKVKARVLRWPEVARAGFRLSIFDNLNTPEDYQRAVSGLRGY